MCWILCTRIGLCVPATLTWAIRKAAPVRAKFAPRMTIKTSAKKPNTFQSKPVRRPCRRPLRTGIGEGWYRGRERLMAGICPLDAGMPVWLSVRGMTLGYACALAREEYMRFRRSTYLSPAADCTPSGLVTTRWRVLTPECVSLIPVAAGVLRSPAG